MNVPKRERNSAYSESNDLSGVNHEQPAVCPRTDESIVSVDSIKSKEMTERADSAGYWGEMASHPWN